MTFKKGQLVRYRPMCGDDVYFLVCYEVPSSYVPVIGLKTGGKYTIQDYQLELIGNNYKEKTK